MSNANEVMVVALLSLMEDRGISQAAVARRLGRAKNYVNQRFNGTDGLTVSTDMLGAIAELSGLTFPAFLLELSERMAQAHRMVP